MVEKKRCKEKKTCQKLNEPSEEVKEHKKIKYLLSMKNA